MKKNKHILLSIILLMLLVSPVYLQVDDPKGESNKWVFGTNAMIDFNIGRPVSLPGSQMIAPAGCASICDSLGQLVLYSNGVKVWNGKHILIADDLFGDSTLAQGVVILPRPKRPGQYFIWTVDGVSGDKGIRFSIANMNDGNGKIFENYKNISPAYTKDIKFTDRIIGVRNFDKNIFWLIAHQWGNNAFVVWNINEFYPPHELIKLDTTQVGEIHGNYNQPDTHGIGSGYIKASSKGNFIAYASEGLDLIELFYFNSKTGKITGPRTITGIDNVYGLEFSPSDRYLYATQKNPDGGGSIYQWNVMLRDIGPINKSKTKIASIPEDVTCGALQLAPNGKIYIAFDKQDYLGVIYSPNNEGAFSHYYRVGVQLSNGISGLGLPTFMSEFYIRESFIYHGNCFGDTTKFYLTNIDTKPQSVTWDFGDNSPIETIIVTDSTEYFSHYYEKPDQYEVKITTLRGGSEYYGNESVIIHPPAPEIDLGADTYDLCLGDSLILDAGNTDFYDWQINFVPYPELNSQFLSVHNSGIYSVTTRDENFCLSRDTTEVIFHDIPKIDSTKTTKAHCGEDNGTATVYPNNWKNENFTYLWNTDPVQNTQTAVNLKAGTYNVTIAPGNSDCNMESELITISKLNSPIVEIIGDTKSICPGTEVLLKATGADNYFWFNDKTTDTLWTDSILVYPEMNINYYVVGSISDPDGTSCSNTADISLSVFETVKPELGGSLEACQGEEIFLDAGNRDSIKWYRNFNIDPLSEEQILGVTQNGTYTLSVYDNNLCRMTDTVDVYFHEIPIIIDIDTKKAHCGESNGTATIIPAGNPANYDYLWHTFPEQITQTAVDLPRGQYSVSINYKDSTCAILVDTVFITEFNAPVITVISTPEVVCPGKPMLLKAYGGESYEWEDGAETDSIWIYPKEDKVISVTGVAIDEEGNTCYSTTRVNVNVFTTIKPDIGDYYEMCLGEQKILDAGNGSSFLWQDGSDSRELTASLSGSYSVFVTDANGCITADTCELLFSEPFTTYIGEDTSLCMGGTINLDAGEGDSFIWNDNDILRYKNIATTGLYSVEVKRKGCYADDSIYILFHDPDSLIIDSIQTNPVLCYGVEEGYINIFASGVTGFLDYSINGGETWEDNNGIYTSLAPLTEYHLAIREKNACEKTGPVIYIEQAAEINIDPVFKYPNCEDCDDGKIYLNVGGGKPPYSYEWNNFDTTNVSSNLIPGNYSVNITDSVLCQAYFDILLLSIDDLLGIPTAFTPNGDGINDHWTFKKALDYPKMTVKVFDHYGNLVFTSNGYFSPWDGTSNGNLLPVNTYYYIIDLGVENIALKGTVTLIR